MPKSESISTYTNTFVGLSLLLALTAGLHHVPLGPFGIPIAIGIGFAKATLIAMFFMHLKIGHRTTVLFALVGAFWFFIFILLTMSDYLTRKWLWVP